MRKELMPVFSNAMEFVYLLFKTCFQILLFFVSCYVGLAWSIHFTMDLFGKYWNEKGWWILFYIPYLVIKAGGESIIRMAVCLVVGTILIWLTGVSTRRFIMKRVKMSNAAPPHVVAYWQQLHLTGRTDRQKVIRYAIDNGIPLLLSALTDREKRKFVGKARKANLPVFKQ